MGHQLEEIQFCIPISILQTLSTAVKKQQRNHFVYEGSICSLGGAQVDCLFTAEIVKQEDRIKLTFASPEGFSVDEEGRTITCDPTGLIFQDDADGEIYDDIAEDYNEEDNINVSDEEKIERPSPQPKRKRGRPAKKKQSLRVVLEKLDTKKGSSYDVSGKSENEQSVESEEEEDIESERSEEVNSAGRRTRTRVIRKPQKYLSAQETPKGTRGKQSLKNKNAGSSTPHRRLQMPPVTPKAALMNSVQLKPVTSSKAGQTQMYLLNSPAQLIEKDGRKQLILPPGAKPISSEEATKMSDALKDKGGKYPSSTSGLKGNQDPSTIDAPIDSVDDEDADPDWEPSREDEEEPVSGIGSRKRKASDMSGISSKVARMTPTAGRRFGKLKSSIVSGRQYLNQLPKTPLVKITVTDENKEVWGDHDYLRQRETSKNDAYSNLRTSRNSRKSDPKKTDSSPKKTEEEDKEKDDVDDGMDFQETFSKQLTIPTVYNMYQVNTDYLKLKDKVVPKRPPPQKPKEVELNEVPRVFRQITFSSKGRPLRIQVRKKKDQVEKERLKKKQQEEKDVNDEDDDSEDDEDEDDDDEEVVKKASKESEAKRKKKEEPVGEVIQFDDMVEDLTVTENQDILGGQFVPVDENGEEIKFLDESGQAINLFDEQGNMRELYTEDGNLIQFVTEEGEAVHAIETEPAVDLTNYDPSLKVESFDDYDEYFISSEDYDPRVLQLQEDEFMDLPIEEIEDVPGRPKRSNSSANNIPCEICCNFFLNHNNLLAHVRGKHRKDKGFQSFENRIKERLKVKCEICDVAAMSDLKLMEHMQKVHKMEAEFKCKTCCKSFLLKKRLLQHEKKVHCSIDQLCHLCPAVFKNPRSLERHIEMHKSGSWDKLQEKKFCLYCKRKFESVVSLQNHIKNRHSGQSKNDNAPISKCWSCDSEFASAKELRKHMIAEHVLHWHKYHCTLCKKVFDSMDELTKHKAQVHSGGIALHCPFCGIGYMARHTLISHISNNHLNRETPYKCPFCPSKFIRAVFLQKHIGVVHDLVAEVEVRKGSCDDQSEEKSTSKKCVFEECDKTFLREKDVVEHILDSHNDHFPHECEICGQRFAKVKYVISHSHAAHKTKPLNLPDIKDENTKEESSSPTTSSVQPSPGPVAKKTITINPVKTLSCTSITPGKVMVSQPAQTTQTPLSTTKAPRRTILLDASGQAIGGAYQIQSNVVTRPVETATTKVVQMKPQTAVHTVTNPSLLTAGRSLLAKHVTAAKVPQVVQQETIFTDAAVVAEPSDDASQMQQQYAIVQTIPDNQPQYTEYVIDTSGTDQQVQQNVDVEQIVYNLNVETNPRAWHYSRMEDHAATLTISQEQTAVMAGDQQSSINVVSAEELWRIINENIDS